MLFILISVTSQVFHQPQLVAEAAAYGPHPEFLSHCKDAWLHVVGLITLADCLIDISVYPTGPVRVFPIQKHLARNLQDDLLQYLTHLARKLCILA